MRVIKFANRDQSREVYSSPSVRPSIHPSKYQSVRSSFESIFTEYLLCVWHLESVGNTEIGKKGRVLPSQADTGEVRKPGPVL